jgi:fucose permease
MATTIASAANPLGVAIGFVFPSLFVPDEVEGTDKIELQHLIYLSFLYQAIIGTVCLVPVIFLFKNKPPTEPSSSAEIKKLPFKMALKSMLVNKSFMLFAVVFGLIIGVFNGLGTAIDTIVDAFG